MPANPGYNKLLTLNSIELSDHGRTYSENRDERSVEVELANGTIKKYLKSVKHTWDIKWTWLPGQDANTVDGRAGRDTLWGQVQNANALSFSVIDNTDGVTAKSYTVFVVSYDEELIKRDFVGGMFFYNVNLQLKEQ